MLSSWDVWATLALALAAACVAWAQPAPEQVSTAGSALERSVVAREVGSAVRP